jgi:hypothetical protein
MIAGMNSFTSQFKTAKNQSHHIWRIATRVGWVTDAILLATKEYNRLSNIIAGGIAVATGR